MVDIYNQDTIQGVTVFGDDRRFDTYYLLPKTPSFQVDENGVPIFQLLKYRAPLDREDGFKGGGYITFGVELSVKPDTETAIKEKLQDRVNKEAERRRIKTPPSVKLAQMPYLDGSVEIHAMNDSKTFVQNVYSSKAPSLYGSNVAVFAAELSPEGATLFEQALQGKGGFVTATYKLIFDVKLPPLIVTASWRATAFYSFIQTVDVNERWCRSDSYKEHLTETIRRSESSNVDVLPGSSQVSEEVITEVRNWAMRSLDSAIERMVIEALPVEDPESARKWYESHDIEHVRREVHRSRVSDYSFSYREEKVVAWDLYPQGILPNITSMKKFDGGAIRWEDHYKEIDLDDPFFRTLNVAVRVNAPFGDLPIHSVEVKLDYEGRPMNVLRSNVDGEYNFTNPNEVAYFAQYVQDNNWKYTYSYQVNYIGASKNFQSKVFTTDESQLTINIDDIGILLVDIEPGDLNFSEVEQVLLIMRYQDRSKGVGLIEQQFIIDQGNPYHRFQDVIFTERDKPYTYKCKYKMQNGKEYEVDWKEGHSSRLYINDPFSGRKELTLQAVGDLDREIQSIFVNVTYRDEKNDYEQTHSVVLSSRRDFATWEFPIIDENSGNVTYNGNVVYRDGTVKNFLDKTATSNTIIIGDVSPDILTVEVNAYLLDFFDTLKMAVAQLKYSDLDNGIIERKNLTFTANTGMEGVWDVKIKNPSIQEYEYKILYFLRDGSRQIVGPETTDETMLILEMPV